MEPGQLCIHHRILCMGRFWSILRTAGTVRPLRRTNMQGALAGMLTGGVMVFVWKYLVRPLGGNFNIYELLPAFVLSCLAIVIVSLLTKEPSKEIYDEFDSVGK